ncbi:MAG: sugar phosphate isomerase/epimerase [Armatimonadetes bacterium]|nr:sugar phosphate isomerase/epimerase [Armatimonadota bacterium]
MQLTLGATTRPWNTFSYQTACESIAKAGYSDVAVFANEGKIPVNSETSVEEAKAVADFTRSAGLVPSLLISGVKLDIPVDESVADYCRLIDAAAALGARWLMNCGTENPATYDDFREIMRQCAPYAESKGVALNMKPHGGIGLTGRMMAETVELVGHPNFSICFDPGNIIYYTKGAATPEVELRDVAPYVTTCIIKDCIIIDGKPDVWILPGEGLVDFRAVLSGLAQAGFVGPLYVECLGGSELEDINHRAARTHSFVSEIVSSL